MPSYSRTILSIILLPVAITACSDTDNITPGSNLAVESDQIQAKSDDRTRSWRERTEWSRERNLDTEEVERDDEDERDEDDERDDENSEQTSEPSGDVVNGPTLGAGMPDDGRLIASNCFGCHGTDGRSTVGFDGLAGESLSEKMMEMRNKDDEDIMIIHSRGYNNEQIRQLSDYFARVPSR